MFPVLVITICSSVFTCRSRRLALFVSVKVYLVPWKSNEIEYLILLVVATHEETYTMSPKAAARYISKRSGLTDRLLLLSTLFVLLFVYLSIGD